APPPSAVSPLRADPERALDPESHALLADWPTTVETYSGDEHVVTVRDREIRTAVSDVSLSGTHVPRVALPRSLEDDEGTLLRWLRNENLPGWFPFTGGGVASATTEKRTPLRG